ncbi:hypothetical protein CAP35_08285 [Chitinophagaceae bacterium IBVUCB1]|nr:hypothetical protein CAP35_08285 [Chitinophagaceae bacterium IBVUCB1]
MKVFILTSSYSGTAAHHLPYLLNADDFEVVMVIVSKGIIKDKKRFYIKKLKKTFKIGLLGAINGIRMRKWFNQGVDEYIKIGDIRDICKEYDIPVAEVPVINCEQTVAYIKESGADLGISLGNGYIGSKVFSSAPRGMINIHHEILPSYQNAQSIIWQIYNKSSVTGYTIHKIDKHIDTGDILYQKEVPIQFKPKLSETIARTSAALLKASADGLVYTLSHFDVLFANAKPQGKGTSYTTPSIWQFIRILNNFSKLKHK